MAAKYCEPCTARGRNPTAFRWCSECEEALCSECTEAHRFQKITRNHHLVDISKIPERINISYNCSKHQHLPFDYFCVDHDEICCKECLSQNHRACKNVTCIERASKNSKRSQSFIDSEKQLGFILEALKILNKSCKENDSRIQQQETNIRKQIATVKEHIIKLLESLEQLLLKQLTEMKNKNLNRLKRQEKDLVDLITSSKAEKEVMEFVKNDGSDKQTFLLIHSSKPVLDEIENKVKQVTDSFVETNDKRLVFCDVITSKVHVCDENDVYQYSILSPYAPWDIAAVPGTATAVMSSRNEPYIQFIDLKRRRILKQIEVHQSGGYGIAATKDNIFVGTEKEIQVLNRSGNLKGTVRLKHEQGPIGNISIGLNGNIYYSNNDEVYCSTLDGNLVFSYSSPRLRGPRKIHDAGNVYILGLYSQNIHQITSTGSFVDILPDDNISEPFGLCFSKDFSKVYIANRSGKTMSVFKINQ
ncbi:unnamed protein product [Mytilus coruscus]|uniref:B box-type domain-containing protein n=1 Tax=Mytilus coruscus TaxID=42192 RepID=A0A6J8D7P8_MYTCO|nr:unnamed protein product [Mytilus coruscus]